MLRLLVLLALITRVIAESDCDVGDSSDLSLFRGFIEANDYSCAIQFVTEAKAESIATVRSEFDMLQRKLTSKLNDLKAAIESAAPAKKITPAFEWCQSVDSVFLNVKFAHKLDAPATLNVEATKVDIQETSLLLEASNGAKYFSLAIPLNDEVLPEESSYDYASVGRMTFTLKKKNAPSRWSKLVEKGFNVQQRLGKSVMHFWHQRGEQFAKELDLLDDEDDDEDDKKRKEKAREKIRKDKEKAEKEAKEKEESTSSADKAELEVTSEGDAPAATAFETAAASASEANANAEKAEKEAKEERERSRQHVITLASNSERDKITSELKDLDAEMKRRKKEVDGRAVEEKLAIEADIKARKTEIEKGKQARIDEAEARAKAALDRGESEGKPRGEAKE